MKNYRSNVSEDDFERIQEKTLWELYKITPSFACFSLSVIEESSDDEIEESPDTEIEKSSDTVLESLEFSKNVSEDELRSSEKRLDDLIESICYTSRFGKVSRITCDCIYGLGCDYKVKVFV